MQVEKSSETIDRSNCKSIAEDLWNNDLWQIPGVESQQPRIWRISPTPFPLDAEITGLLIKLGSILQNFYSAVNRLYLSSDFSWVNDYLDIGKPEWLVDHARMNYQKKMLPRIIRPDIILTEDGPKITELDSVPGGFGQLDAMSMLYDQIGYEVIGSSRGMLQGFDKMICATAQIGNPALAIVISDESADYRPEMDWIAKELRKLGRNAWMIKPEEVIFTEDGLFVEADGIRNKLDIIYRFFELFDLANIPKSELMVYAAKKKKVVVTPPFKHQLEEKILLALIHHPMLFSYWNDMLGSSDFELLRQVVPETWILDSRPLPPNAVIPGFEFRNMPINNWNTIKTATQRERRLIIKPSGFSPMAWGSHGVIPGHDVPSDEWSYAVEQALCNFTSQPSVLQRFYEGKKVPVKYLDTRSDAVVEMQGRVRLSPYYFVADDNAELFGVLATVVPLNKKLIHGMVNAVMAPCMREDYA